MTRERDNEIMKIALKDAKEIVNEAEINDNIDIWDQDVRNTMICRISIALFNKRYSE
ncbi:MAG: hypothetical protein Q7R95_00030 [bacterium]|nr:hypothetical protein [bacterium]